MTTQFAEVNGTSLAWEESGAGQPIVLVHAGIADRRMWRGQVEPLNQTHRVIRFDQRGFGESPMPAGEFSRLADLIALLDHLAIESAIFVGCSMGGSLLLDLAIAHPNRVNALVISNSTAKGFDYPNALPADLEAAFDEAEAAGDIDRINELEVQYWIDGFDRPADQPVDPDVRNLVLAMNLIALQNEDAGGEELAGPTDTFARLGEIAAPALVIVGDHDTPRTIAGCQAIAERIPNACHTVIDGTAHLPALENPEAFNRIVQDFLKDLV